MPCGSRERRRSGHRCLRCRKDHVKCNGRRPCAYCSARGVNCVSPPPPPSADHIITIEYGNKESAPRLAYRIKQPLVQDSWRYISVFFRAIGLSGSPIIAVFSFDSIGGLVHDNELVNQTVSVFGGIYASRNSNLLRLSAAEKCELHASWLSLKSTIKEQMQGSHSTQFTTVFLCALLVGIVELLFDKTGNKWRTLIRDASEYLHRDGRSRERRGEFEAALVRFLRMSDVLGAISMCEDVAFPMAQPAFAPLLERNPAAEDEVTCSKIYLDTLLDILERWSMLQYRALLWAAEAEQHVFPSVCVDDQLQMGNIVVLTNECLSSRHAAIGIEIVCQASRLQREIITSILSFAEHDPKDLEPGILSTIPYYHWGLAGLSRLFLHPAWSMLNCELPVMEDNMIRKQAITALDYAEGRLSRVELEVILYIPITYLVGLEMKTVEERKRVMNFLSVIRDKGFKVAASFEQDLQMAWTGSENVRNRKHR